MREKNLLLNEERWESEFWQK